tara:strand:- start:71 stop:313 length:243 start_codon:yes stop_codon:yes gene_type:complete
VEIALEIVLGILKIVALFIMLWAFLIGIVALPKGWPNIFKSDDGALMYAFKVFVMIVSAVTWFFIIVWGSELLFKGFVQM